MDTKIDLESLSDRSLSSDPAVRAEAVKDLRKILENKDLGIQDRAQATITLAQTLQFLGHHSEALLVLQDAQTYEYAQTSAFGIGYRAVESISARELGDLSRAEEISDQIYSQIGSLNADSIVRGGILLELGKTFRRVGRDSNAIEAWVAAADLLKDTDESQHIRALSNIAFVELHSADEAAQENAAERLERLTERKAALGDISGMATNYSTLALYFRRRRRFGRALHYARRDVSLSRKFGDIHEIAIALGNLADIYAELLQFKMARRSLIEAIKIAKMINGSGAAERYVSQLSATEELAKEAIEQGVSIGEHARCACESGEIYLECCGRADFDFEQRFSRVGVAEEVPTQLGALTSNNISPISLDYVLRSDDRSHMRVSWQQLHVRDGWMETFELADMANLHLNSAKVLLDTIADDNTIAVTLSVVLLSVCSLEAFINQVVFLQRTNTSPSNGRSV